MPAKKRKKNSTFFIVFIVLIGITSVFAYKYYSYIYKPSVNIGHQTNTYLFVKSNSTYDNVLTQLKEQNIIENTEAFDWVAKKKSYPSKVKAGRYLIKNNMNNNDLVNLLRSGQQEPVSLTFISVRTLNDLAGVVSRTIEADSIEILEYISNKETISKYGFNKNTFIAMFIPNTYEVYWNTTAEDFVARMAKEFKNYWNEERIAKAKKLGLSQSQVSTLASIVEQETKKNDEKRRVAGVYVNRLQNNWPLQADPTVIYAHGDFSIRRVLLKHLEINSPYNTYKNTGLPPGPICIPSSTTIDAVLNFEKHNYFYFCAKEDFSGYHNFARTLSQHNANARRYQRALSRL